MRLSLVKDAFSPWRAYVAEFLGTFVFVFIAAGASLANAFYVDIGTVGIALATGLSISAMMYACVHLSGAHLNPAVTIALWLAQKFKGEMAVFYILAQITASFTAAGLLQLIFGLAAREFFLGGPTVGVGISQQTAVVTEAVLTAILIFAVFATMVDRRGPVSFGPLAVGFVVVIANIFGGPISGAAINPARAIGPLVLVNAWSNLLVYIVGPLAGALFGLIYEFLFLRKAKR